MVRSKAKMMDDKKRNTVGRQGHLVKRQHYLQTAANETFYSNNALNQLVKRTEDGVQYNYSYNATPRRGCGTQPVQRKSGFSFVDFGKEVLTGMVTGGLASTVFYGADKAG